MKNSAGIIVSEESIQSIAKTMIGIPYRHLGRDPAIGLDCWGMVIEFFKRLGVKLDDPVSAYSKTWFNEKDYISEYAHTYFDVIDKPAPLCVISLLTGNSPIPNHLAVMLDNTYVLNCDEHVGVHKLRHFAILTSVYSYLLPRGVTKK